MILKDHTRSLTQRLLRLEMAWMLLAGATGFEPAISCLTGRYVRPATPRPHTT